MTQPPPPQIGLVQRLRGLAATLAILLLLAGVPFLLVAIGAAPWHTDLSHLRTLLSSPDDGTLALVVIAAVAWIAWVCVAISVVLEVVAQVRGLPAPTLPGFGVPQRAAGHLVAVAALLFVATPSVVAAFPAAPAHAAPPAPLHQAPTVSATVAPVAAPLPGSVAPTESPAKHRSTINYTVKRGDSLWKIAERLLGDGTRFPEIVDLNEDVLNGRPDFITSGTVLKVPHEATESDTGSDTDHQDRQYVVQAGDTLSGIAEAKLGDPLRYPELFDASRHTVQPDGDSLTDPDLIRPGWTITIPGHAKHKADPPEETTPPPPVDPPSEPPSSQTPAPDPIPAPTGEPDSNASSTTHDADEATEAAGSGWLLPGLTGAGAVLAALVLLAVRSHRKTQLRYRRPGQTIAPPPPELHAVEKTTYVAGASLTTSIEQLDRALNHLAGEFIDAGKRLPMLVNATLSDSVVTLMLAEDADLPAPWTGTGHEWSMRLDDAVTDRRDVLPPYPLLVTIGQDDDGLRLVNLEHLGTVELAGDHERSTALARHIAAELALNPWAVLVEVDLIGLGAELAPLDHLRLHCHDNGDGGEQVVTSITDDLTATLAHGGGDPDPYRAVITTSDGVSEIAPLLDAPSSRIGAVLLAVTTPAPGATQIEVDRDGRLQAPALGLDLQAAGLTAEEATACAAIVDLTRESEPVAIVPFAQAADGWRSLVDQAGALRPELTDVRDDGPVGERSLLPEPSAAYVETAAATDEDVEVLAPVVTEQVRRRVEEADPGLDDDVAEWFDEASKRPRLTLLGPVNAQAHGQIRPVITKRKPYFVEIFAFLALHPKGVTASELADAFSIAASRARTDISSLRDWLGTNPTTGAPYLPAANESPAYVATGVKTYQVQDVLIDLDLFRRLRARGEARGADGINDLKTAMSLVIGMPFSHLRERGWSWLLDTERIHETIACAIVDTAHLLVIDALATGDLALARQVAETACEAAPYDDICRLDLVKVAALEGHEEAAESMLDDDIFNRTDDHMPPIDLPKRTSEVVSKERWGTAQQRR